MSSLDRRAPPRTRREVIAPAVALFAPRLARERSDRADCERHLLACTEAESPRELEVELHHADGAPSGAPAHVESALGVVSVASTPWWRVHRFCDVTPCGLRCFFRYCRSDSRFLMAHSRQRPPATGEPCASPLMHTWREGLVAVDAPSKYAQKYRNKEIQNYDYKEIQK